MHTIELSHRAEIGHRIPNHQGGLGKCARLHGHSYRFEVQLGAEVLDPATGFVVDFGDIKRILDEWDHRMLLWVNDPVYVTWDQDEPSAEAVGVVRVPWVPTAEHMAQHLAERFLREFDHLVLAFVGVWETEKSSARSNLVRSDLERRAA